MVKASLTIAAVTFSFCATAHAQTPCSQPEVATVTFQPGTVTPPPLPSPMQSAYVANKNSLEARVVQAFTPKANIVTLGQNEYNLIKAQIGANEADFRMVYRDGPGTNSMRCAFPLKLNDTPTATPPATPRPDGTASTAAQDPTRPIEENRYGVSDCPRAGPDWLAKLRGQSAAAREHLTVILFRENGVVCYRNRDYGVQGDPIYAGVFLSDPSRWDAVVAEHDPCSLQPEAPAVYVSGDISQLNLRQSDQFYRVYPFPARSCYNASVAVRVKGPLPAVGGLPASQVNMQYLLNQYARYRGTIQVGILNTPQHDTNFGLRDSAGTKLVFNKGPVNRGPEYVASLVLYGIPHYLPTLFGSGERYSGRDIINDQSLQDRLGAVLGVGLNSPGKRFVAGFSLEVIYGINILGVWDIAQITELVGLKEGQPGPARAEDIPTRKSWQRKFVTGLSVDIVYMSKLLKGAGGS